MAAAWVAVAAAAWVAAAAAWVAAAAAWVAAAAAWVAAAAAWVVAAAAGGGMGGGGGGGGMGGGGGGGGGMSDVRAKHAITLLGQLDNGLGFYRFSYLGSDQAYVGVMAQEVEAVRPEAVVHHNDGYLRVDYDKLGFQMQTYEEWVAAGERIPNSVRALTTRAGNGVPSNGARQNPRAAARPPFHLRDRLATVPELFVAMRAGLHMLANRRGLWLSWARGEW